jgi:hypothetical protein
MRTRLCTWDRADEKLPDVVENFAKFSTSVQIPFIRGILIISDINLKAKQTIGEF